MKIFYIVFKEKMIIYNIILLNMRKTPKLYIKKRGNGYIIIMENGLNMHAYLSRNFYLIKKSNRHFRLWRCFDWISISCCNNIDFLFWYNCTCCYRIAINAYFLCTSFCQSFCINIFEMVPSPPPDIMTFLSRVPPSKLDIAMQFEAYTSVTPWVCEFTLWHGINSDASDPLRFAGLVLSRRSQNKFEFIVRRRCCAK